MQFCIVFIAIFLKISSVSPQPSPFGFNVQYIGNNRYVSSKEEQNRTFCENYWCTNDADYLFTKSAQYSDVVPCVDFKNFSVGGIIEIDQVSDRKLYRGMTASVQDINNQRLRKVLMEKVNANEDNRVVKAAKNTFQKCLKSPHTFRHLEAHR